MFHFFNFHTLWISILLALIVWNVSNFFFNILQEKCEIACLRAIVLFNPDCNGLSNEVSNHVETLREKVYATLEEHCRMRHERDPSRFAKLLLRLPALRSIGLKCAEHHFFVKLVTENRSMFENMDEREGTTAMESFIKNFLEDWRRFSIQHKSILFIKERDSSFLDFIEFFFYANARENWHLYIQLYIQQTIKCGFLELQIKCISTLQIWKSSRLTLWT